MERRRLDAEEIRDAMLLASGQLDLRAARRLAGDGPGATSRSAAAEVAATSQARRTCAASTCRSCAGSCPRSLQVFDVADPNLIVGKRDVTTVPTQALYLMNNPFVLRQAQADGQARAGRRTD